jgi:pyruvate formate lyase activating enzyme
MKEAKYYRTEGDAVRCLLCPHRCLIRDGKLGLCSGKKNIRGRLYATNYGETVSIATDPMEKKPLYHYYPGASILSVAPNGCSLRCPFCQNWQISQGKSATQFIGPEKLLDLVMQYDSVGVAYTYSEPLIWFEYLLDAGKLLHAHSRKNVLVTNGMINEEPLNELIPLIDAANIDLKGMDEHFYRELKGDLKTVLNTIRVVKDHWHVELTNLIIPTKNDSPEALSSLVDFVAELGDDIPLHFSRYFPCYKYDIPSTPKTTLEYAWKLARKKLKYVYVGNIWIEGAQDTRCPDCGQLLISRSHFSLDMSGLKGKKCKRCGYEISLVR